MTGDEDYFTPPEYEEEANKIVAEKMLPAKSRARYEQTYNSFVAWQKEKGKTSFAESVFIVYFDEKSKTMSPNSLWSIYSMLRTTCELYNNVNIANFTKMEKILKRHSIGYVSKKSKVFTAEELNQFMQEAPDKEHLADKVVAIFGISGACRSDELVRIKFDDINLQGNTYVVDIPDTKTYLPRRFYIHEKFTDIIKKYIDLRPKNCPVNRFFLNFQHAKCTNQPIGKNKFMAIPKKIAEKLNLKDAKLYTGHSFRRTSATLLAEAGGDLTTIQKHGGWKSASVAAQYVDETRKLKYSIASRVAEGIFPSTSKVEDNSHAIFAQNKENVDQNRNEEQQKTEPVKNTLGFGNTKFELNNCNVYFQNP